MKKSILIFLLILASISFAEIQDFTLNDFNGTSYKLGNYTDNDAIVIMFISSRCPISNSYNDRMNKIYGTFHNKGIVFLGINSNNTESVKEIKKHAVDKNFKFPVLIDKNNVIADQFGASVTPEVYVLSPNLSLLYHGRIDDSKNPDNITSTDLQDALYAIISNKDITTKTTKAFGCGIKRAN